MARFRTLAWVVALACVAFAWHAPASAEIVNAAFKPPSLDLSRYVSVVESERPTLTIELPDDGVGGPRSLALEAQGPGPVYRWAIVTLRNPDPAGRSLVMSLPMTGFAASGFDWPQTLAARIGLVKAASGDPVERLDTAGLEAVGVTVPAGATHSYAIEVLDEVAGLTLWQRPSFEAEARWRHFLAGAVLSIAGLLAAAVTVMAAMTLGGLALAGALFAWPAVAFIAVEFGYLPAFVDGLSLGAAGADRIRAMVEALMLAGLAGLGSSLFDLRRYIPMAGMVALLVAGAALGLAAYGWFEPLVASGVARMAFGAVVLAGAVLIVLLARHDAVQALESTPFWFVLAVWTGAAAAVASSSAFNSAASAIVAGGLLLVLLALALTLLRFVIAYGGSAGRLVQETDRRALALAGSELAVWDWQASKGKFFVGAELDRMLGFEQGTIGNRSLKGWIELIHPADRAAYVAAVEAAEQRGRGGFSHEFRLRRGDGSYRWFQLRARAAQEGRRSLRLVGTLADITSFRRSEDRLLSDAVRDRVTGLPNRALFVDRLERAVKSAVAEEDLSLYVIVIGLDRFEQLNSSLGHEVGDSLLAILARRLSRFIGAEDTLARLRGDQFGIIFRASRPLREVNALVEELKAALAQPVSLRPREVVVATSIGVARLRHGGVDPEELLKDAEVALYEAIRKGRSAVEFFTPDMRDERSRLISLEQDLRRAVERNEIEIVFQPIMRLSTRELAGFEALIRWRRGGEVLVEPDGFIGLAEEIGVIRDLGRYMLTQSVRQAGIWYRAFRPRDPIYVAVNLSSSELLNADLVDEVRTLLTREDVNPQALRIEITESLVMQNLELSEKILERLRQMGVGLSCDDFGTGYSALSNLRRLPFDTLKMDKSFLDHEEDDERARVLLESVLMLAHDLGLSVVAEGIEKEEQLEHLTGLGCDYGQGFFIGAPASSKQVMEALSGLPYSTGARGGGMQGFWARFVGRRDPRRQSVMDEEAAPKAAPSWQEPIEEKPEPSREEPPTPEPVVEVLPLDFEGSPFSSSRSEPREELPPIDEREGEGFAEPETAEPAGPEPEEEPAAEEEPAVATADAPVEPRQDVSATDEDSSSTEEAEAAVVPEEEDAGTTVVDDEAMSDKEADEEIETPEETLEEAGKPEKAEARRLASTRQLRRRLRRAARPRSGE
ncbi:MAG: EAL domain-containing protein [Parvibaculaceae bacterium]